MKKLLLRLPAASSCSFQLAAKARRSILLRVLPMKITSLLVTLACVAAVDSCSQIVNGSFESGFTGWNITPGCFIIGHPGTQPIGTQGQVCADLGGGDIAGAMLSQTFNCEPDTDYLLTFNSVCNAGNDLTKITEWQVRITAGNAVLAEKSFSQKNAGQPVGDFGFVPRSVRFHTSPTSTTASVRFIDITPNGGVGVDTGLDQVGVKPLRRDGNLLLNSSFERGLDGWNADNDCSIVGHKPDRSIGTDGYFSASLGREGSTGAVLSQTFNCPQAGPYRLDFDGASCAGTNSPSRATWDVVISADGRQIIRQSYAQKSIGSLRGKSGFRHRKLRFSLPDGIQDATVSFINTTPDDRTSTGVVFDQVKLVPVSHP